ncbi:hypothetical protein ACFRR6_36120 [Streptomyces sp. NPDC056891]|uniref:hypothetical protein n=1 Tax=Streptomyces sp. NPDC056891 TaxID=3345961 RepID=UPI00367A59EA
MNHCVYCSKVISAGAELIPDDGANGRHANIYKHALGDPECTYPPRTPLSVPHVGGVPINRTTQRRGFRVS